RERDASLGVERLVPRVEQEEALEPACGFVGERAAAKALFEAAVFIGGIERDARVEAAKDDKRVVRVARQLATEARRNAHSTFMVDRVLIAPPERCHPDCSVPPPAPPMRRGAGNISHFHPQTTTSRILGGRKEGVKPDSKNISKF